MEIHTPHTLPGADAINPDKNFCNLSFPKRFVSGAKIKEIFDYM